jgi:hypothetical protein
MFALLTAIDGPAALLNVKVEAPVLRSVQPKVFVGLSNTKLPMVRLVSSAIEIGPVRLAVANVAVLLAPFAMMLDCQFAAVLQL